MALGFWAKDYLGPKEAGGGSGGGVFKVNITPDGNIKNVSGVTLDKTYDEILAAQNAGQGIVAYMEIGNGGGPDPCMAWLAYSTTGFFACKYIVPDVTSTDWYAISIEIRSNRTSLMKAKIA